MITKTKENKNKFKTLQVTQVVVKNAKATLQ